MKVKTKKIMNDQLYAFYLLTKRAPGEPYQPEDRPAFTGYASKATIMKIDCMPVMIGGQLRQMNHLVNSFGCRYLIKPAANNGLHATEQAPQLAQLAQSLASPEW